MIISVVEADDFIEITSFIVCTENIVVCCETEEKLRHNYGSER